MRSKHRLRRRPLAEINVVPYIDVMLVLLVIFMITAPLLTQGVHVQLPKAEAHAMTTEKNLPIIVSVNQNGNLFLNTARNPDATLSPQDLMSVVSAQLDAAKAAHETRQIYVKGDRNANYGEVMKAMVLLQKAGASGVGLITQAPDSREDKTR